MLCCDAVAHNDVWGKSDTNGRGISVLDFIVSRELLNCNSGNEPTFLNRFRKKVIDITLCCLVVTCLIHGLHVSNEPTLSDHRHIIFRISSLELAEVAFRNLRRVGWDVYNEELNDRLECKVGTSDLDRRADNLRKA